MEGAVHSEELELGCETSDVSPTHFVGEPKYIVTCDGPFAEVGKFNGMGNEIGSALAATAEIIDSPAEEVTARFLGLSNRRNRETVVVAVFAPGKTE